MHLVGMDTLLILLRLGLGYHRARGLRVGGLRLTKVLKKQDLTVFLEHNV
jgi:hypothetical protein